MPERDQFHRTSTRVLSAVMLVVGVALVVRTISAGGGIAATGVILGVLFIVAGGARLYMQVRGH